MVLKYLAKSDITWRTNDNPVTKDDTPADRKKLKPANDGKYNATLWKAGDEVPVEVALNLSAHAKELITVVEDAEIEKTVKAIKAKIRGRKASHGYELES